MSSMNANPFFEQAQRLTELWAEMAVKMAGAGLSGDPDSPPPDAARAMRSAALAATTQYADQFMRSPQFLQMVKQSIDASIEFRRRMNEFFTVARHGTEGVAREDVAGLLGAMQRMEGRTVDRLEEIASRIDALGRRLDAIEGAGGKEAAGRNGDNGSAGKLAGTGGARTDAAVSPGPGPSSGGGKA
jgi:hypothetical protein